MNKLIIVTSRVVDVSSNICNGGIPIIVGEQETLVALIRVGRVTVWVFIASVSEGCSRYEAISPVSQVSTTALQITEILS